MLRRVGWPSTQDRGETQLRKHALLGQGNSTCVYFTSQASRWTARTSSSCAFRCHRAKFSAARASQHEGEHTLSRRALQSELLAALLVTAHGWRPEDAMADSQQGTDSADQDLDLTITDKVSWTHFLAAAAAASAAKLPAGVPGSWFVS